MKKKADKAINYTHRLFAVRARSERELRERLYGKGFDRETVARALEYAREKSLTDDENFSRQWVESRTRSHPEGDMLLRRELKTKGVPAAIIDKVLSEKTESEETLARTLALQKCGKLKSLPAVKARKKLFDFLARRGFNFETIDRVLREILED